MNTPSTIPNPSLYNVVTFDILSDGQPVDPAVKLLSIEVNKEVNRIPTAELVFKDGNIPEETFDLSNTEDFVPGRKITIKVGRDGDNKKVFAGIITRHCVKVRQNGQSDLVITCRDESVKMTIGRHSRYFEEKKDSEILEEIIAGYGNLSSEVKIAGPTHKEMVQYHTSDWDFMLSRADVNGRLVIVDDGLIQIKEPDTSQEALIALHLGNNLLQFEAEMDAHTQWKKVEGRAWDYKNQQLFTAETDTSSFAGHGNISSKDLADVIGPQAVHLQHGGHVMEEELELWTDACMLKSRLAARRGFGHLKTGYEAIKPGIMVELKGVGNRFNGKAFVTGVRHIVRGGAWNTLVQFGLSADWYACKEDVIDFPAGGLLPAVRGLQIGIVRQLENDPDGEDRILVNLPLIDPNGNGIWTRQASLDAGAERGAFFRPEIGDEVIVGFLNDDPRDAVVLGMLHSSAKPAPISAKDDNHEKGFVTRGKMRIWFDDDKKIMTLDTPAGNLFEINEDAKSITLKDQNGNKIIMDQNGIEINSPKDIKITAGGKMEAKATQDLTAEGLNVDLKANAQLKAKGQAGAEFSSSGIAELKGSLVKVN